MTGLYRLNRRLVGNRGLCPGDADDARAVRDSNDAQTPPALVIIGQLPGAKSTTYVSAINDRKDFRVSAVVTNATELARVMLRCQFQVAIVDVELPGLREYDVLRQLHSFLPDLIVVLTGNRTKGIGPFAEGRSSVGGMTIANYDGDRERQPEFVLNEVRARFNAVVRRKARVGRLTEEPVVFLGGSTGAITALKSILRAMPVDGPAMLVSQHTMNGFCESLSAVLDSDTPMTVRVAREGDQLCRGHVYVAPSNRHLVVARDEGRLVCGLLNTAPTNGHRPSVDVMFRSAATVMGKSVIGVLLSGMGKDGALGLWEIRRAGGHTIIQDEQSSVVWGMPGAASRLGAAQKVLPPSMITHAIQSAEKSFRFNEV